MLDPEGYYTCLGLEPAATRADIVTAFRAKARILHPDVPKTGNASAFVAVKQAYDVLSSREQRAAYDRKAREALQHAIRPEVIVVRRTAYPSPPTAVPPRQPRLAGVPVILWFGLAAFLCLCVYQAVTHLLTPPRMIRDDIRPNAATVAPLSPDAHAAVLYGSTPVRLPGTTNFYVVPAATPAVVWRLNPERTALVPFGQLPPFSAVQAVRLIRQNGMLEVLVTEHATGYISADRLTPGNADVARRAYCSYNAGPTPFDGELLERGGSGSGTIEVENRAPQPVVVKLRDAAGTVALSVFLGPGGHGVFDGLPEGTYHPEFAIGELWSRACNAFAVGMRARRIDTALESPGNARLVVEPAAGTPAATDISDQAFEQR
jgi:hypothetical protein